MNIEHEENDRNGSFFIMNEGKKIAALDYTITLNGRMNINHTMVAKAFEGKGIAAELVKSAIDYARKKSMKIKPYCPYAAAFMKKHAAEYEDVLA